LRGKAKSENCSFRAALADFEQALNAKPVALNVPAEYLIARGDAHLRLGEHDPALADFNAAAAKSPNFDELAHIHQMRGYIHSDKGEERLAITEFTALIRLKPDFADAYWLRAVSYENLDDYAHA